jgi:hypothetical protein
MRRVAPPVRERRERRVPPRSAGAGTMWRNRAFAMGTDWTTTPEFGHEDERTRRRLLCATFAAPHPPHAAGMNAG